MASGTSQIPLLYLALQSEFGLEIPVSNPERGRALLYAARREAADPALEILQFRLSQDFPNSVIITKATSKPSQSSPDGIVRPHGTLFDEET